VFVNAFNPHDPGHANSLAVLEDIHARSVPVILPAVVLPEVASAIARATDDGEGAIECAVAVAGLPHVTIVALTAAVAREAAQLAATHRLRGADAVCVACMPLRDDARDTRRAAAGASIEVIPSLTPREAPDRRA
jgi:predicted nucleic acid-binding protein